MANLDYHTLMARLDRVSANGNLHHHEIIGLRSGTAECALQFITCDHATKAIYVGKLHHDGGITYLGDYVAPEFQ